MTATINASTSSGVVLTPDNSGDLALQSAGTTKFTVSSSGAYGQIVSGTAVASTSGTSIDFTGIPSWAKRITLMFNGVSLSSNDNFLIQIGSGSVTTSGYTSLGNAYNQSSGTGGTTSTAGFVMFVADGAGTLYLHMVLTLISGNTWVSSHSGAKMSNNAMSGGGSVALGGALDRVRITTTGGSNTFDAGSINILYEG